MFVYTVTSYSYNACEKKYTQTECFKLRKSQLRFDVLIKHVTSYFLGFLKDKLEQQYFKTWFVLKGLFKY